MAGKKRTRDENLRVFWSKVNRKGPMHPTLDTACWVWTGGVNKYGYGRTTFEGEVVLTHRLSWTIHHGEPLGQQVLHHCDNPACVRPDHLFVGTQADNMEDMFAKGRGKIGGAVPVSCRMKGERHVFARLDDGKVRAIRERYAAGGVTMQALADEYGVTNPTVWNVIHRKFWSHVS